MHLFVFFLNRIEQPERMVERLRQFGLPDPLFVRARSTAAALSTEVPVFAGLRSLALGADEDRHILLTLLPIESKEEAERLVSRLQLELDADQPPSGRVVAVEALAALQQLPR